MTQNWEKINFYLCPQSTPQDGSFGIRAHWMLPSIWRPPKIYQIPTFSYLGPPERSKQSSKSKDFSVYFLEIFVDLLTLNHISNGLGVLTEKPHNWPILEGFWRIWLQKSGPKTRSKKGFRKSPIFSIFWTFWAPKKLPKIVQKSRKRTLHSIPLF